VRHRQAFAALKIGKRLAEVKGVDRQTSVVYLVPSITLISQSLHEWTTECERGFAPSRCAPTPRSARARRLRTSARTTSHYPRRPIRTGLLAQVEATARRAGLTLIFSTYQSIAVVAAAQDDRPLNSTSSYLRRGTPHDRSHDRQVGVRRERRRVHSRSSLSSIRFSGPGRRGLRAPPRRGVPGM
jgi:hypothetical protein